MVGSKRAKKGSGIIIQGTTSGEVTVIAGVDAGSTETRVCIADKRDADIFADSAKIRAALDTLLVQYRIPSTYANVDDAREISPVSDNIEDNWDSTIVLVRNSAEKPMLSRHRVLRGRKIQDAMGVTSRYLDSSTNKTDNVIFYTNIIDALGYAIMEKYNGSIPSEVNVNLFLSVRPKELTSKCREKMSDNLLGQYMFCWKDIKISINIVTLEFSTEPEAQISGTTAVYDLRAENGIDFEHNISMADKLCGSDCYIHVEGGGSSIGVEVIRNGVIVDACSSTFPLGGNYMAQVFIDRYRELKGRAVTKDAANNAIVSCTLRDGKNILDVADLVASCKDQVAMNIAESLRHEVIDTLADLTLNDVEFITLGGRLFADDAAGCSIGQFFQQYIQQVSQHTDVYILPENFIAQGNLIFGLNSDKVVALTCQDSVSLETVKAKVPMVPVQIDTGNDVE